MKFWQRNFVLLAFMVAASGLAVAMRPTQRAQETVTELEQLIPSSFGSWSVRPGGTAAVVNPQQQAVLDRIYSQTLTRTYQDSATGGVVMVSVAYGEEQSKESQVHRPEVCYPAQGFQIDGRARDELKIPSGGIPVIRLVANSGTRHEPITYWVRIGNQIVRGMLEQKLAIVAEGLSGNVADGLLFRVSSVGPDAAAEYRLHDKFVNDLLPVLSSSGRNWLLGKESNP